VCLKCVGCTSRAGEVYCLGEDVSRSGESFSPKRECEERSKGSLNIQPKREMRVLAKRDLAQASVTRLSEGSWLVLGMVLAQAR